MERIINLIRSIFICFISFILVFTGSIPVNAEDIVPVEEPEEISTETELNTVNADSIMTDEDQCGFTVGESRYLSYALKPANSDEKPEFYIYHKDNDCITLDSDGYVTATSPGTANVRAGIANGSYIDYYVFVSDGSPTSMTAWSTSYTISEGQSLHIGFDIEPYDATYVRKTVVSDNPSVVSVEGNGTTYWNGFNVYGESVGTANITITCDNGLSTVISVDITDVIAADNIIAEKPSVSMKIGEEKKLSYILEPSDATEKPQFILDYANNNCITLDSNGLVHANDYGSASVYAQIANGNSVYFSITVAADPETMSFEKESYTRIAGKYEYIYVNCNPQDAQNCRKHVVSSDSSVVRPVNAWTNDSSINLEYVGSGTATVTVTADNGVSCSTKITVLDGDYADYIRREDDMKRTTYLKTGDTVSLKYYLESSDGRTTFADEKVTWKVEYGDEFISVDDTGAVTALSPGYGRVSATITNGSSVGYTIQVYDLPESIKFDKTQYILNVGDDTVYAYAQGMPSDAASCPLTYTVVHPAIAEMNGNQIVPKSGGKTMIFATAENGVYGSAELIVRDGNYADSISSTNSSIILSKGESKKIEYTLSSYSGKTNFDDEKISWSLSAPSGAYNLSNGIITALTDNASATIKATLSNGRSTSFYVTTCPKIETISFKDDQSYMFEVGSS